MSFWLIMRTAAGGERPFRISKPRTVIGREATSDLQVSIPTVAPRHCEITYDADGLHLTDLGSGTGTLHNGTRIEGTHIGRVLLADADRLTVGSVTFEVRLRDDGVDLDGTEPKIMPTAETCTREPYLPKGARLRDS